MTQTFPQSTDKQIEALLRTAGYQELTALQKTVIPVLLKGKNSCIETREGQGTNASFIIPLLIRTPAKAVDTVPTELVLCANINSIDDTVRQIKRLDPRGILRYSFMGAASVKKEAKKLKTQPRLLITTASMLIDLHRRSLVNIGRFSSLTVNYRNSSKTPGFSRDIQFILQKTAKHARISIFSDCLDDLEEISKDLRRPVTIKAETWDTDNPVHRIYKARDIRQKLDTLEKLVFARGKRRTIVYCRTMAILKQVEKRLSAEGQEYLIISPKTSGRKLNRLVEQYMGPDNRIILTVCLEVLELIPKTDFFFLFNIPDNIEQYRKISEYLIKTESPGISILQLPGEEKTLEKLQEMYRMRKGKQPANSEVIAGKLKGIEKRILEANPDMIQSYKKLIKKHIPITRRAYVGALLLMESMGGSTDIDNAEMKTLFVNIGKNRRVFHKDLSRFFARELQIPEKSIGGVRVFDSYSFIEIPETLADRAISEMDGKEFRGRSITVNFARKKD